jgi:phenylacetate-CoA ligase
MFPKTFYEKICSLHPNVCIHNLSYTTTETGPIGYQCTSLPNDCFHIHEDAIWVEVIEPITKQPIMDVPGNIIVTPFSSTGIPLLRYDTGDKGILRSVSCQCGHKTRVIQLLGRSQQSIKICGAIIQKSYIIDSIRSICKEALVHETNIQVQQIQNHDGIQVKILLNKKNWTCISARRIEDRLRQDHHFSFIVSHPACRLFGVSSVPFTEFAMTKSGKTPFFITIHEKQ